MTFAHPPFYAALTAAFSMTCALLVCAFAAASRAQAQGYTVGGSRPGADLRLKIHADYSATSTQQGATAPKIGLAIPASPVLEVGFDLATRHIKRDGETHKIGVADAELKAKLLLVDAKRNALKLDASAELKVVVPLGDAKRGFGDGVPGVKLPVTFSRRMGPWEAGGLLGAQFVHKRDKTFLLAGVLLTRDFGPRLRIGGEVASEFHTRHAHQQEVMANFGLRYAPRPGTDLFVIAGHSIAARNNEPALKIKLGFEITLRKGRRL